MYQQAGPAVWEQGSEALPRMDAVAVQQQAGMGVAVIGGGKLELADVLVHGKVSSFCNLGYCLLCAVVE